MDPSALRRLAGWLDAPGVRAVDPEGVAALRHALEQPDPPASAGRWGSLTGYVPGPGRRRLVAFDRRGRLLAALRWSAAGPLGWAKCRTAHGEWIGIEPRATSHPAWGISDRLWRLDPDAAWRPLEALTVVQAVDWARPDFIPPAAEPRRLPAGAGSAVLNLLAGLMKDQGVTPVRYRGPYPSEALFTTLLECFRYDPAEALPLERFTADAALDWHAAPHEAHEPAPGVWVQLRHAVEKVVVEGVAFYRADWQGVRRREPRVIRSEGDRVVCSFWALGGPLWDRLVLDAAGEILAVPAEPAEAGPPAPLAPAWGPALGECIARESAPALARAIQEVMAGLALEWGTVRGDLLRVEGGRVTFHRRLRQAGRASLAGAASREERAEQALRVLLEVARLLAPPVRARAQALLEALPEAEQWRIWQEAEAAGPPALSASVGRLVALVAGGGW